MAYIKTLKDNELVGGTDITDVYPISSTQAIYRQDSEGLAPENVPQLLEESLQDIEQKLLTLSQYATKVSGATANNFAALDANGNLKDSGKSTDDFLPKNSSTISVTDGGGVTRMDANGTIATSHDDITFTTGISGQTPQETTLSSLKAKYTKPSTGIPKTDLASDVQTSLTRADKALERYSDGTNGIYIIDCNKTTPDRLRFDCTETSIDIYADNDSYGLHFEGAWNNYQFDRPIDAPAFIDGSDSRLKDIKGSVEITAEQIASLPAVKFTWKKDADKEDRKEQVGTIAQKVQKILPEVVSENKDGMLGMQYGQAAMVSVINLARTVVEQQQTIEALTKRLEALEKKIQ